MKPDLYIAVAGNIGAGKSTLVEQLSTHYRLTPFYEPNEENPYMADFYADMDRWAFHSQMFFLGKRFRMHRLMEHTPGKVVMDRTIHEDAEIFATALHQSGRLAKRDFETYMAFYQSICQSLRKPDLLIYVTCSVDVLLERIHLRGRKEERNIPVDYLQTLQRLYDNWIERYTASPVIHLATDNCLDVNDLLVHPSLEAIKYG